MQKNNSSGFSARRRVANVSTLCITQLHLRNPWVIAWWSATIPGFGHILLSKYLIGFLLFTWEVFINLKSNLNLAIIYSFTGRIQMTKEILNINWLLLYIPVYIFAIWDSYRRTVDINNQYVLAKRENAEFDIHCMNTLCFNYLDKKSPWAATIWSFLMPGAGQLYIHRIINAGFILIWWIINVYYSKMLPAIHLSLLGRSNEVLSIVNPHWLSNIPSIYLFSIYDAYVNTVENNKLFNWEQKNYFKRKYKNRFFKMPSKTNNDGGEAMYVISTFEQSINLELAVTEIESKGIPKEKIIVIPMNKKMNKTKLFDSMLRSDGFSLVDLAAILGSIFMTIGTVYGFVLRWGPIWWGIIGLGFGLVIGLAIKLIKIKRNLKNPKYEVSEYSDEVVIIIECNKDNTEVIKDILWSNHALGVSELNLDNSI